MPFPRPRFRQCPNRRKSCVISRHSSTRAQLLPPFPSPWLSTWLSEFQRKRTVLVRQRQPDCYDGRGSERHRLASYRIEKNESFPDRRPSPRIGFARVRHSLNTIYAGRRNVRSGGLDRHLRCSAILHGSDFFHRRPSCGWSKSMLKEVMIDDL